MISNRFGHETVDDYLILLPYLCKREGDVSQSSNQLSVPKRMTFVFLRVSE